MENGDFGSESPTTIVYADDLARGFLGNLTPSIIPHFPYQGRGQFYNDFQDKLEIFSDNNDEWVLITGVSEETYHHEFEPEESKSNVFSRARAYDQQLHLLLIRMVVSTPHEVASVAFHDMLRDATRPVGVMPRPFGGYRWEPPVGGKVPDQAWTPNRLPRGRPHRWPSAVLEVTYSETRAKLRSDVRYWFRASGGDVKVVFTVTVEQRTPQIIIEKWEQDAHYPGRSHLEQVVTVSKSGHRIRVSAAPFTISFESLFLVPADNPEHNVIEIDEDALMEYARTVWKCQGFEPVERV
ncbi:uncharacterized protein BJX67DRAFT_332844 [Aspergillus lucknowensis]|uniref:Uncharacterized protein n=1 Tax=Aspergillus lucknowensis TaxID=176173 RepID=A0ABR4LYB7_9EURO